MKKAQKPKKTTTSKPVQKKPAVAAKKKTAAAAKKSPTAAARKTPLARADYGAPIDGFFARQPPQLRPILETLRKLVEEAAPEADSSLKWGMPFYSLNGRMMCALSGHKSHVNLILSGPPGAFADPEGRLTGEGKTGRHLKLKKLDELPREAVRGWLHTAVAIAREPK